MRVCTLSMELDGPLDLSHAPKIRGYIGNRFRDLPILHHHVGSLGYLYSYPLVQYKVVGGRVLIVGVDAGADAVRYIEPELDRLVLERIYAVREKKIEEKKWRLGPCCESKVYEFLTPWLALNEKNYRMYLESQQKAKILRDILRGNVLSLCKGLSHRVGVRLRTATFLKRTKVTYKGIPMIAFTGKFLLN
ncbi:MAG: CRISPR-associated endonuclease Cas6, partial [Candidatus Methanomethylicaceae archaeon]